jgi:hypothetical protein
MPESPCRLSSFRVLPRTYLGRAIPRSAQIVRIVRPLRSFERLRLCSRRLIIFISLVLRLERIERLEQFEHSLSSSGPVLEQSEGTRGSHLRIQNYDGKSRACKTYLLRNGGSPVIKRLTRKNDHAYSEMIWLFLSCLFKAMEGSYKRINGV